MKNISLLSLLLISILLFSCGGTNCEFSNLTITTAVDGKQTNQKTVKDCYSVTKEGEGELAIYTIEGKETSEVFSMSYYDEKSKVDLKDSQGTSLKFLNVFIGGKKTEWRKNKGHNIYKIEKQDNLSFIFGENVKKENSVSVSVTFSK